MEKWVARLEEILPKVTPSTDDVTFFTKFLETNCKEHSSLFAGYTSEMYLKVRYGFIGPSSAAHQTRRIEENRCRCRGLQAG
jgi:hypothetical protein